MKQNIYRSAATVTIFSTIEKALSFFYRIMLSRMMGAEGLGIYQICLSVFAVFLTASSSGVPVSVSRLMAKHGAENNTSGKHSSVTAGVIITLFFTIPTVIILLLGRNLLSFLFADDRCINIFILLLPGLILTSVYAVMRGAFWGNKQFLPYSIIELLEDSVMVILGCVFVSFASTPISGATAAVWAVLISYIFSFILSLSWYFKTGGKFKNPKQQLKSLFISSLPITAMRTSTSVLNSLVAIILPLLLMNSFNLSNSEAIALYGVAIGMSVPILYIPSSLIGSISVVVAPELSENYYKQKNNLVKYDIEKSLRATIFIAAVIIPVLFVCGDEIGVFLYSNKLSGEIISKCAFLLLPMCISMITTTLLNSVNCEKQTLIYFIIGAVIMLVCIAVLTKFIGVYSYMIGLSACFLITCVLNLKLLTEKCKGIKYVKFTIVATLGIIVSSAFGMLLDGIISLYLAPVWQALICAFACVIFIVGYLYCFEMCSVKPLKRLFSKN